MFGSKPEVDNMIESSFSQDRHARNQHFYTKMNKDKIKKIMLRYKKQQDTLQKSKLCAQNFSNLSIESGSQSPSRYTQKTKKKNYKSEID